MLNNILIYIISSVIHGFRLVLTYLLNIIMFTKTIANIIKFATEN